MKQHLSSMLGASTAVAVLSMMVIAVSGAQAASLFLVEASNGVKSAIQTGDIVDVEGGESLLLTALGITVACEQTTGSGTVTSESTLSLSYVRVNCEVIEGGSETCKIGEEEVLYQANGEFNKYGYPVFTPPGGPGEPFTSVEFQSVGAEECHLIAAGKSSEIVTLTGEEAGEFIDNPGAGTGASLILSPEINEEAYVKGLFISGGENKAARDAEFNQIKVLRPSGKVIGSLITH